MHKLTKKEKREMIAAAMKTISQQQNLSPSARERGLATLQKAFERNSESR
ncbi:MAG: hypothetical protein GX971_02765 [Firmicutes bacterium]|jgi:DNA-binding phage protein|nr:hypothetical protein [Bacillota bacterium]